MKKASFLRKTALSLLSTATGFIVNAQGEIKNFDKAIRMMSNNFWKMSERCCGDSCESVNVNTYYFADNYFDDPRPNRAAYFQWRNYEESPKDHMEEPSIDVLSRSYPFRVTYHSMSDGSFPMTMTVTRKSVVFEGQKGTCRYRAVYAAINAPDHVKRCRKLALRLK